MRTSAAPAPRSLRLLSAGIAAVLTAGVLAGCGKGDDPEPVTAPEPTAPALTPSATPTPSPTPLSSPTASAKPTKKPTKKPTRGSGDADGDDEPAAAGGGVCAELSEAEVGAVLGNTVTGAAIPGGGCAFAPKKPRPPAANFIDHPYADMSGGMTGAKENATSAVEGEPEDLAGIGDAAFVVTGTSFGGDQLQGAGAVRIGDRLISVELAQSAGLTRGRVRSLVVSLLRLAVAESS
ncbi:hypothetical protein ABIE44_000377 [Marmoricola sp. OAE513]|uniref:hypothetical protein n=1 Tax=Marmoricola sp. OAE513 TaxID=2817894 RepID=UPI001AE1FCC0